MATSGGEYALIPTLIPLNNDDNMMMMFDMILTQISLIPSSEQDVGSENVQ